MGLTTRSAWILVVFVLLITQVYSINGAIGDIQKQLRSQLSKNANIYLPGEANFGEATARWSDYHAPNFTVVVEVATENDVATTVRYANTYNLPFLAINGGHGTTSSLSEMNHGIEIWLHKLNWVVLEGNGKTATFGGGINSGGLMDALWAKGKQTVNGVAECTSYLGPALGGGHGILQAQYGLMSDQFVTMSVVTADGILRKVSGKGMGNELFWGMQGAGHNFGIVTSFTSRVYDVPAGDVWAHEKHVYTHRQVEAVFGLLNQLSKIRPVGFLIWTDISRNEELDFKNPVIDVHYIQQGAQIIESKYIGALRGLRPVKSERHSGTYTNISEWIGTARGSRGCEKGGIIKARFPINLQRYNVSATRELFDTYANGTANGSPLAHSVILIEDYSNHGVDSIPSDRSAFPHRSDSLLASPIMMYTPSPEIEARAREFGNQLRNILLRGSGTDQMHSYVNYASGDEAPESWYGYEPWRMEKLKALKRKYDPHRKFSYYGPIPQDI